jgi:NAD(P)-dependent dehydrogenase (short-subunit alcohol dehydrogenase family)
MMMVRTWFITGVGSGLGKALAVAALGQGDKVAGTLRDESARVAFEALAPGRAFGYRLDLSDEIAARETLERAERVTGGINVLVNNAGYGLIGAIEEASSAEIRRQFDVNVFAPIALIQTVLPFMRARKSGLIINVTSVSGLATWVGTGHYCASKYALEAIGETLIEEVRPLGIKVINIEPGGMRTDYASRSSTRAAKRIEAYKDTAGMSERILADHAGHEPGDPNKIARIILGVAAMKDPPLNLLLGADAMLYATRKLGQLQAEIGKWAPLTFSTAFDE